MSAYFIMCCPRFVRREQCRVVHCGLLGVQGQRSFPRRVQEPRKCCTAHRNTEQLLVPVLFPTG